MLKGGRDSGPGAPAGRRRGGWIGPAVRRFDALVRWWLGIFEYADDDRCVLRLSVHRLGRPMTLPDGTRVEAGQMVGELHLWNEHLPPIRDEGADVAWALAFHRRFVHALRRLAVWAESDAAGVEIVAFRARTLFEAWGGGERMRRLARRSRFEPAPAEAAGVSGWLLSWVQSVLHRGLMLAFNPAGVRGRPFHRRPQEFWITRGQLLEHYGGIDEQHDSPDDGRPVKRRVVPTGAEPVGRASADGGDAAGRDRVDGAGRGPGGGDV